MKDVEQRKDHFSRESPNDPCFGFKRRCENEFWVTRSSPAYRFVAFCLKSDHISADATVRVKRLQSSDVHPAVSRIRQPQRFSLRGWSPRCCGLDFPETSHWTRNDKHFPRPLRKGESRLCLARPPPARRNGAPCEAGTAGPAPQRVVKGSQPTQCHTLGLARGSAPSNPRPGRALPWPLHHPRRSRLPLP